MSFGIKTRSGSPRYCERRVIVLSLTEYVVLDNLSMGRRRAGMGDGGRCVRVSQAPHSERSTAELIKGIIGKLNDSHAHVGEDIHSFSLVAVRPDA
jgi:hypothetical protein